MKFKKPDHDDMHHGRGMYLRSSIFGWQDGAVSTMALLAGLTGAAFGGAAVTNLVIIIAALAEIFAGSISMALGNYIGTKSQLEVFRAKVAYEKKEIEEEPEREEAEVRQFYSAKGFNAKEIEMIVKRLRKNKAAMLDVMIKEELGGDRITKENPIKSSAYMFVFFSIGGIIPLVPYFALPAANAILYSMLLTGIALFGIGAAKTYLTGINPVKSGIEVLIIGMIATFAAYQVGIILGGYF